MEQGGIGTPVTGTAFMLGRGMEHWHPDPSFYYQAGAGPVMDMGPYYLTMMVNLLGPVRRVQAVATSGQAERLITAEGPKQRHAVQGRHADQRPVAARVRLRRDRDLRRIVGRLPSLQPSDRAARHRRVAAPARPRQFRRRRRRLRRGRRLGGDRHLRPALRRGELAGGCAGPRELPDARSGRSRARGDRRTRPAGVGRSCVARARGHGGDPAGRRDRHGAGHSKRGPAARGAERRRDAKACWRDAPPSRGGLPGPALRPAAPIACGAIC